MAEKILSTHEYAKLMEVSESNTKKNAREGKVKNLPGVIRIDTPTDKYSRNKYLLVANPIKLDLIIKERNEQKRKENRLS